MKRIFTLIIASLLISGVTFSADGVKKSKAKKAHCANGKTCSKNKACTGSM